MGKLVLEDGMPPEAERIARHIVGLEKAALDRWLKGDTSGYADLWSKDSFSYFDAVVKERVDSHAEIMKFLAAIDGKFFCGRIRLPKAKGPVLAGHGDGYTDISALRQVNAHGYGV